MKSSHAASRAIAVALGVPIVTASLALFSSIVIAQEDYPSKPISMVVPFPPGGVADTVGRPIAEAMTRLLKQPIIVENKAGAGGGVGMGQVAKAKGDGYTLLMALSSITILPEADKVLNRSPLYQLNQFKAIARFTADPTVLVVRADSPWKTFAEFIADVKKTPGKYTFGSSGNYGTMHVPMEMLKSSTNTFMVHVPYTGAGPALLGMLSNQVDALATGPSSVVSQIKAGKVRALAHWGESRLNSLPDVPSLKELGYPVQFAQWAGLFVPASTPEAIVNKLRDVAKQAAVDTRVVQTINTAGSPILYLDKPEFEKYVEAESKLMSGVVKRIGKVE
jgi:tripartite-type tricarboxylate transporter receptor subunit TctC